jgi:hypothetical protein
MEPSKRLARNLIAESKAYGYTLAIWGGGAILVSHYGIPSIVEVALYVGGALCAMAVLALVAFGGLFTEQKRPEGHRRLAASMVHVAATGGSLLVSYLTVVVGRPFVPPSLVFSLVGFSTTILYNVLLVSEDIAARFLR